MNADGSGSCGTNDSVLRAGEVPQERKVDSSRATRQAYSVSGTRKEISLAPLGPLRGVEVRTRCGATRPFQFKEATALLQYSRLLRKSSCNPLLRFMQRFQSTQSTYTTTAAAAGRTFVVTKECWTTISFPRSADSRYATSLPCWFRRIFPPWRHPPLPTRLFVKRLLRKLRRHGLDEPDAVLLGYGKVSK